MPGANTLAYFVFSFMKNKIKFFNITPKANVVKLFAAVSYEFGNKLECLSLASLSSLV